MVELMDGTSVELAPRDLHDLLRARALVETVPLGVRLSGEFGTVMERGLKYLPDGIERTIGAVAEKALALALEGALLTLDKDAVGQMQSAWWTKVATIMTGMVGGAGGAAATLVELPATTTIIMRAIAAIAREEGENLRDPATQAACVEVFALGGPKAADDAADAGYWSARLGFAMSARSMVQEAIKLAAQRFGVALTQKLAAQAAPVVGALAGAAINLIFTAFYQDVARGHFIIRRLERAYGRDAVRAAYGTVALSGTVLPPPA